MLAGIVGVAVGAWLYLDGYGTGVRDTGRCEGNEPEKVLVAEAFGADSLEPLAGGADGLWRCPGDAEGGNKGRVESGSRGPAGSGGRGGVGGKDNGGAP